MCWGETERREDGTLIPKREATYTEGVDTPPPLSLAVAVELKDDNEGKKEHVSSVAREDSKPAETQTRIVVFGDSDFASNNYFARSGGGALFLNTVNWLTLEEDLIAIRPVGPESTSPPTHDRRRSRCDEDGLSLSNPDSRLHYWRHGLVAPPLAFFHYRELSRIPSLPLNP